MKLVTKSFFKKFYKSLIIKIFQFFYGKPKLLKKNKKDASIKEFKINFNKNRYKIFKDKCDFDFLSVERDLDKRS